jgi:proline dehydrogenase
MHGEVSVKLTQLGLDLDVERTFTHASRLAAAAAAHGAVFWIDMEGSAYTEATVAFYERLKAVHPNVGLCLQAYLRRTAADVDRLLPLEPAIRLVKGAYAEPAAIAHRSKSDVDANYVALAVAMLEAKARGSRMSIGLGTHDVGLIQRIADRAAALRLDRRAAFEVQMLYGVREDQQRRLAAEGYAVRDLIAYGEHWYPWYMRRLAERPANIVFALRQIVG